MVQCEICKAWQHGQCMHYDALESVPVLYYCEECRPDLWTEVVRYARSASETPFSLSLCLSGTGPLSTPDNHHHTLIRPRLRL